jgi:hypothetical protein
VTRTIKNLNRCKETQKEDERKKRKQKSRKYKMESVLVKQERDRKQTGHGPEEKRTIVMNKKLA